MKNVTVTTKLNIKVVSIFILFVLIFIGYQQIIALQDREKEYSRELEEITAFIVQRVSENVLYDAIYQPMEQGATIKQHFDAMNQVVQPEFDRIFVTGQHIKYGFFSSDHQGIIALGPRLENTLICKVNPKLIDAIYTNQDAHFGKLDKSLVWYSSQVLYHVRPVYQNDRIIGYVFASFNIDAANTEVWKSIAKTVSAASLALIVVLLLFQEAFIQFKEELEAFAQACIVEQTNFFDSKIPELKPILTYIKEQTDQMTKLDRLNLVGEMAASIAHEVRNPLTTVRGFLQFLGKKEQYKDAKEHFDVMISEMDRANEIITEFLTLAKNKAMYFEERDLNEVILNIMPLLKADALRLGCSLEFYLQALPTIRIDENSIRQLLINLTRNAIEASRFGGIVKVSTAEVGKQVVLSVADQGVGIAPEVISQLGMPFVTTKENGVGIGLAVCYRIVQRHQGAIDVQSRVGIGTTFTISFPTAVSGQESEVNRK